MAKYIEAATCCPELPPSYYTMVELKKCDRQTENRHRTENRQTEKPIREATLIPDGSLG